MKGLQILSIVAATALIVGTSFADDELGKKPKPKPPPTSGGGGGGGGPQTKNPPQQKPPEQKPPERKPPEQKPPERKPPENKPPTSGGGDDGGLGKKPKPGNGGGGGNGNGGGSNGGGSNGGGNNGGGNSGGNNHPPIIIGGGNSGGNNGGGNQNGNGRGDDQLGRIDNSNGRRPGRNDDELSKSNRRDRVYNTVNNSNRGDRNNYDGRIGNAPIDVISGSLQNQVLREDRNSARYQNLRHGYYGYDRGWCDDDFWYSHYVFVPTQGCYVSPWYYYNNLPGYIKVGGIVILTGNRDYSWRGSYYNYRPNYYNNNGYGGNSWFNDNRSDIDYAVDDLVSLFERRDRRALSRLIPRRGQVDIYFDRRYSYSLDSDDFYDLMLDAAMTTRTRRYEIVRVERNGDEIEVQARHEFVDPWGRSDSVYHWYRLSWERDGYVISKFGTTNRSAW